MNFGQLSNNKGHANDRFWQDVWLLKGPIDGGPENPCDAMWATLHFMQQNILNL